MTPAQRDISRKLRIFNYTKQIGNVTAACRHFGNSHEIYYSWRRTYEKDGEQALINSKPCPENPKLRTKPEVEEKILHLLRTYHIGQQRIAWYLDRYHSITILAGGVRCVLTHRGLNRLPRNERKRSPVYHRYEKQVPGHHVQIDVKFLDFRQPDGQKVRRFQYGVWQ